MQTLEIKVPADKIKLVKDFLKKMDISFKVKKENATAKAGRKTPNAETLAAMNELKAGKGKKFKSVADIFDSI
jgi:hypothetical protein